MTSPMKTIDVHVVIIGAGSAGLTARRAAKRAGARSVLMIDSGPLGTTCARVGCMPSKLLIAAADAAYHANHAGVFGVEVPDVRVDGPKVLARVQQERDRFVGFVLESTASAQNDGELIVGRATLISERSLLIDDHTQVNFDALVIATGTTPFVPPPFRGLDDFMLTNEGIFELTDLPESLLVVGLGVIGLELGQAMSRLGVRTTLVGLQGMIGPLQDPKIKSEALRIFKQELDLHEDYVLKSITPQGDGVRFDFTDSTGKERSEHFSKVLMAAGRRDSLDQLGLATAGVTRGTDHRYDIDPYTLQIGDKPWFVAGDANGLHPLLHEAADDGHGAGANAATFPHVEEIRRRAPIGVVFTDPNIAVVGGGWSSLSGCSAAYGEVDYGRQGRARTMAQNRGWVRIYAARHSGQLLGAEMVGPRVEHTAHLLAWAIQQRMTVNEALQMPYYHPVIEEGIRTALRDLQTNLRHGPRVGPNCEEVGPGA